MSSRRDVDVLHLALYRPPLIDVPNERPTGGQTARGEPAFYPPPLLPNPGRLTIFRRIKVDPNCDPKPFEALSYLYQSSGVVYFPLTVPTPFFHSFDLLSFFLFYSKWHLIFHADPRSGAQCYMRMYYGRLL